MWRPPGGKSIVKLNYRVRKFLDRVMSQAIAMVMETPTLLIMTHGLFIQEVYRYLSTIV